MALATGRFIWVLLVSVPYTFELNDVPLFVIQIVGARFDEATVLRIGAAYEGEAGWHRRRPPIG